MSKVFNPARDNSLPPEAVSVIGEVHLRLIQLEDGAFAVQQVGMEAMTPQTVMELLHTAQGLAIQRNAEQIAALVNQEGAVAPRVQVATALPPKLTIN